MVDLQLLWCGRRKSQEIHGLEVDIIFYRAGSLNLFTLPGWGYSG